MNLHIEPETGWDPYTVWRERILIPRLQARLAVAVAAPAATMRDLSGQSRPASIGLQTIAPERPKPRALFGVNRRSLYKRLA